MLLTTPHTFVTAEVVTAATMNTEIRDAMNGIQAAWTAFTPTWTGSATNPALGNGTLAGKYTRFGKTLFGRITLITGSTTTYGTGVWRFSPPVTPHTDYTTNALLGVTGNAALFDTSVPTRAFRRVITADPTYLDMRDDANTSVTNLVPWTWAVGDALHLEFQYETA